MIEYDDENVLTKYVWEFYLHLATPLEQKAGWAVIGDDVAKIKGRDALRDFFWKKHRLAEDPEVMALLADGIDAFRRRLAMRLLRDFPQELFVNRCPRCNRIARTPKAKQCPWCFFHWHEMSGHDGATD